MRRLVTCGVRSMLVVATLAATSAATAAGETSAISASGASTTAAGETSAISASGASTPAGSAAAGETSAITGSGASTPAGSAAATAGDGAAPSGQRATNTGATTQHEADRLEDTGELPPERPERHVTLMPVVGIWNHPFEQSGWTAKPGPVWGLDVRIEPFHWLGIRGSVLRGNQPISVDGRALAQGFDVYQPTLEVIELLLRAEPTLQLSRSVSGYIGVGMGWGRFIAPEAVATPRLRSFERTAVHVSYEGAIGIAYEPRVDWVVLDLSLAAAFLGKQSGNAYQDVQAFSDAGHRYTLSGLSKYSGAYRAMFGIGFIL